MEINIDRLDFNHHDDKLIIYRNGKLNKLMLIGYIKLNKIYFTLTDYSTNNEWLVSLSLNNLNSNRILYLSLNWLNNKQLTLYLNGLLIDTSNEPKIINKQDSNDHLIINNNNNLIYQLGSNNLYHYFSIRFIRRDFLNDASLLGKKHASLHTTINSLASTTSLNSLLLKSNNLLDNCLHINIDNLNNLSKNNQALVNSITNLNNFLNGFYLTIKFKLYGTSQSKYRILQTPNILLNWIHKTKLSKLGLVELILKIDEFYYYTTKIEQIKRNKNYKLDIRFNKLNKTLQVYLNNKLQIETQQYSYYDQNIYDFSDTSFNIGPNFDNQLINIDYFKLYNCTNVKGD